MHVISLVLLALAGLSTPASLGSLTGRRIPPDILPMHDLPDVLGDLQLVINDNLVQRNQCEPEPQIIRELYVLERVLPRELKVVARSVPICIEYYEPCNQSESDVLLGVGELVVDEDHGQEGDIPEEVLGGDDFVEHHEDGGLHEHHEEEVEIEGETGDDHQAPLRQES